MAQRTPGADAALLDLCRRFDADAIALRHHDDATAHLKDDDLLPLLDSFAVTMNRIIATRAKTDAGLRAKGGALHHALMQRVAVHTNESFEEQAEDYEMLAFSLTRDIAVVLAAVAAT
jgi:hypothetical protein